MCKEATLCDETMRQWFNREKDDRDDRDDVISIRYIKTAIIKTCHKIKDIKKNMHIMSKETKDMKRTK